ncbi:UDP-glucose 4-epimerase GalE [Mycoplasma sp. P36-A1]|uniref:UDP-glucose 4-epimerase GalE n=1 Tax=Mycoplasma sp. P36-A1 TaxID=3252900 RepID=UPI003C2C33BF
MSILVTGGAGYIGRYITDLLIEQNEEVIIVDNLSTGHISGVNKKALFYEYDIRDQEQLNEVFKVNKIDCVIHLAAKLSVEESAKKPYEYYDVNVAGTLNLLKTMKKYNVKDIVFSSTAAVYGDADLSNKIDENYITDPVNVYGRTKLFGEKMIEDAKVYGLNYVIFRYFNVAGGNKKGYKIEQFTTLIPKVITAVHKDMPVTVYGNDYPSIDGTCIRDFIHVEDLAKAHILAAKKLMSDASNNISGIYNLGSSQGFSVLEIIKASEKAIGKNIEFIIGPRRQGDLFCSVASSEKAFENFGWKTNINSVEDIINDMWQKNTD